MAWELRKTRVALASRVFFMHYAKLGQAPYATSQAWGLEANSPWTTPSIIQKYDERDLD